MCYHNLNALPHMLQYILTEIWLVLSANSAIKPKMADGLNEQTSSANTKCISHQKGSLTIPKIIQETKNLISAHKTNFTCNIYT